RVRAPATGMANHAISRFVLTGASDQRTGTLYRAAQARASSSRGELKAGSHAHELAHRGRLHFAHHLSSVHLHGVLGDVDLATDLLVEQPRNDPFHDLAFTRRQ